MTIDARFLLDLILIVVATLVGAGLAFTFDHSDWKPKHEKENSTKNRARI